MFKVGQLVTVNIPQEFVHNAEEFFIDGFTGGTFNLPIIAVDSSTLFVKSLIDPSVTSTLSQ